MARHLTFPALVLAAASSLTGLASLHADDRPTLALEDVTARDQSASAPTARDRSQLRARLLAQFDRDGDGQLSPEERQAMRDALKQRFARWRQQLPAAADSDGDGTISKDEARTWFKAQRAAYDADGDGELSTSERQAFRAHLEELGLGDLIAWIAQHRRWHGRDASPRRPAGTDGDDAAHRGSHNGKRGPPPAADFDGDGTITRAEGRRWFMEFGPGKNRQQARKQCQCANDQPANNDDT